MEHRRIEFCAKRLETAKFENEKNDRRGFTA